MSSTAWVKTPEVIVDLDYGTGKSVVTGQIRIAFVSATHISVQTRAHVNDHAPAVTYRGKDYLINLAFTRQPDGTVVEHECNTPQNVSPRRTSNPWAAAPKTIRAAIVQAIRAAIDATSNGGYTRAAAHASAAQRLHSLEPQRAELAAQLAALDAEIERYRAALAANAPVSDALEVK